MDTDLTSISTFGWFSEPSLTNYLEPVSTHGWWYTFLDIAIPDEEDLCRFILNIDKKLFLSLYSTNKPWK